MALGPFSASLDLAFLVATFVATVIGYAMEARRDALRERVTRLEVEVEHLKSDRRGDSNDNP